jgi:hypothetical protein
VNRTAIRKEAHDRASMALDIARAAARSRSLTAYTPLPTRDAMLWGPFAALLRNNSRTFKSISWSSISAGSAGLVIRSVTRNCHSCCKNWLPSPATKSAELQSYWEENRIERTTANPRASARKKDETLVADRAIPIRVPERLA